MSISGHRGTSFSLQESVVGGRHTLRLAGELDIAQAAELEAVLNRVCATGATGITLDLSGLTFMGSTGLRTVLLAKKLCRTSGREFGVVPGPANIQHVFDVAGLGERVPFVATP